MSFTDPFRGDMTLVEAQELLRKHMDDGINCPACVQFVKMYPFGINAGMCRALILMYRRAGTAWVNVPELGLPGGHFAKLRFWGLIEKPPELRREDGSSRVGIWRVTSKGGDFIHDRVKIPRKVKIYNNRAFGFVDEADVVGIREALGKRFDYTELMQG